MEVKHSVNCLLLNRSNVHYVSIRKDWLIVLRRRCFFHARKTNGDLQYLFKV